MPQDTKLENKSGVVRTETGRETTRNLEQYIDFDVVDRNDKKIGTLHSLWSDHTGEPAFIGVRTGWIFGKTHVVPAENVQVNERDRKIRLPYDADTVKNAPAYDADAEMTEEKEREVLQYYGLQAQRTVPPSETEREMPRTTERQRSQGEAETANMQLSEEELKIGKRQVESGGVRLRKIVRTEVVVKPVELAREEIVIERVPAGQEQPATQVAFEQQEVYIPLRREEAVIQKEFRVREEIRARKATQTEQQQVSEKVRREDVEVEATGDARRGNEPAEQMREREERPRSQRQREEP